MKKFLLALAFMAASCGTNEPLQNLSDVTIGTAKLEGSLEKAADDVRNEYDRTENRVEDTLYKANMDVVAEEHRMNDNLKETGSKANSDTLDTLAKANQDVLVEEKKVSERVKDTAKKTNMDVVEEEHKFNDRSKDTASKANSDTNAEKERLKDAVLGTDERQIESNDRRITDLERRVDLIEALNQSQDAMLVLYMQQMVAGDKASADLISGLRSDLTKVEARVDQSESDISVLQTLTTDLTIHATALEAGLLAANGDIDSLEYELGTEIANRMGADADILADLAAESSARAMGDVALGAALLVEALVRSVQVGILQNKMAVETAQRIAGDATLNGKIILETIQRQATDSILDGKIAAEKAARIAGDNALAAQLAAEVTARQAAIAAEVLARANGDAMLTTAQNSLSARVTTLETAVASNCSLTVVGPVVNVDVRDCSSYNQWFGCTGGSDRKRLYSADLKMQCLGKPATTIQNVLFETSPL